MQKVAVQLGERSYPILISPQLFNQSLTEFLPQARQVVIISNPVVAGLYLPAVTALFPDSVVHSFILPDGEAYKTLSSFEQVMSFLLEQKINRDVLLVALGGGVIGDLTGFVAAEPPVIASMGAGDVAGALYTEQLGEIETSIAVARLAASRVLSAAM